MSPTKSHTPAPSGPRSLRDAGVSFDTRSDYYIGKDDKDAMIEAGTPLLITAVSFEPKATYGERWMVEVIPADPNEDQEPRGWSFTAVTTDEKTGQPRLGVIARNASFEALATLLDTLNGQPIGPIRVVAKGQFHTIEDVTPDDLPAGM